MRSQQSFMSFMNNKDKGLPRKDNDRLCCTKCRFSTKDIDVFGRHVALHEEVTFSCALCSHVSYSKTESQKHVVTHTGSYPYRCSFCSYGAVRRDYMLKHIHHVHKSRAEGGFLTDFSLSDPTFESPSVPDTQSRSVWPERNVQCVIPNTAGQSKANAHVEYPSGSQPRGKTASVIGKTVSQTSSKRARMTCSTSMQCVTNTTPVAKSQFTGSVPSISHLVNNSLQVVLRSREENGNLSNAVLSGNGQSTKTVAEKPIQKAAFPRIHTGGTEVVLQSQRVVVPEKVIQSKFVPRVKVRLPAEFNTPLRPLLNTPMGALSQRNVPVHNVQTDQRATTGTNVMMVQKVSLAGGLPNGPIKPSERGPLPSIQKAQTAENSNQPKLVECTSVQVELLAPLNQPIQHNKPLTVSCPEEINIPAGCLVELVEVKNVNGTRELELRMIPPNGLPQDPRNSVNGHSPVINAGKLSFKCQVAASAGCTVSPSKSLTSHKAKQQPPLASTAIQSTTKTVHPLYKPQCSAGTAAQSLNKLNLKPNGTVFKPSLQPALHDIVMLEGTELSSEGLPVISSVYSLCPTPASTHSISPSMPEHLSRTLQTNRPVIKLQGEFKVLSDPECVLIGAKDSKDYVKTSEQSVVCSFMIKKEDKTEEKYKVDVLGLKETKAEHKCIEEAMIFQTRSEEKLVLGKAGATFEKCSNLNTSDLKETANDLQRSPLTVARTSVMPKQSNDNISDQDKVRFEFRSDFDGLQCSSQSSYMYPKVALVRIPSSQLETTKKPEVQTQDQSLTARPVLCCILSEKNMSSGPEGAIKLIIKRDLPGSEKKNQDHDGPPRKKHKKGKWKTIKCMSSSVVMGCHNFLTKGQELRLTPLKEDQHVKLPGPNQPVVVLNHPNPSVQMASVGVQTMKNFKWISSAPQMQEQTGEPASKQPSFKMKLKKVKGQKYEVIEFVLRGVTEKLLM